MLLFILLSIVLLNPCSTCPDFCYCDGEKYASCRGQFPFDLSKNVTRLEVREIIANETLTDELGSYPQLEELKLQQCHIGTVDNTTFSSNTALEKLDLSQNLLTSIGRSVFADLVHLRYLDLSSNLIESVEFVELANLEQLNLRDNSLIQLTSQSFLGLEKVQYLNLDSNNITTIEVGTFQYLTNLTHLILSSNPLKTLSRLDFFGSRLQYIDVSQTGLDRVPQSLTKFVRDLRLAKNQVNVVSSGDFDSYPYLGLLVLDDNCVKEIENDALGRLEYLVRLWLNGNCLTQVPANFPRSLLALYMEENKLDDLLSYSFKGLRKLEQLFLQRNQIRIIQPCAFCDLVNLKSLDLQANRIENLTEGVFSDLVQLENLDLSQNNLKVIESKCLLSLNRLTSLQISRVHTTVVKMDESLFDPMRNLEILEVYDSPAVVQTILDSTRLLNGLRNIRELNFMHNLLSKIRSDFPSFFPSLKTAKLSGNLWYCDRTMLWLLNWMKQSSVQFYNIHNIQCAGPPAVQSKAIINLTYEDFLTGSNSIISEAVTSPTIDEITVTDASKSSSTFYDEAKGNSNLVSIAPLISKKSISIKQVLIPKRVEDTLLIATSMHTTQDGAVSSWTLSSSNATALARTSHNPERPYRTFLVLGGALLGICCLLMIAMVLLWLQRRSIYYQHSDEMSTVALTEHHGLYHISECGTTTERRLWENTNIQSN